MTYAINEVKTPFPVKATMVAIDVNIDTAILGDGVELFHFGDPATTAQRGFDHAPRHRPRFQPQHEPQAPDNRPYVFVDQRLCATHIVISTCPTLSAINTLANILNYQNAVTPTHNVIVYSYSKETGFKEIDHV